MLLSLKIEHVSKRYSVIRVLRAFSIGPLQIGHCLLSFISFLQHDPHTAKWLHGCIVNSNVYVKHTLQASREFDDTWGAIDRLFVSSVTSVKYKGIFVKEL